MAREALIMTIRVEVSDQQPAPDTWPAAKQLLDQHAPSSTRVELLDIRED